MTVLARIPRHSPVVAARPDQPPTAVTSRERRAIVSACAVALAAMLPAPARAQATNWPSRPTRIMVGASPGGGTDVIARMLAEKFAEGLKQPFVVENRPGASNTIAADVTAKAPPDGYTLLVGTNTAASIAPHLIRLAYDPLKDLDPVGLIVLVPNVLVVSQSVPANNVSELLGLIRSKPGTFQYASSGVGSTQHIAGAAFVAQTGVSAVHVPYKGSAQAHVDLISGQVQMMFDTSSSITPQVKTGRVRPLAVMTARRSAELPDVPTLEEAGVKGLEMSTWYGMFVTGGTPPSIRNALTTELRRVVALPDVAKKLRDLGGDPGAMTQAEFAAFNRSEFERYGKLLKEANIKLDQ